MSGKNLKLKTTVIDGIKDSKNAAELFAEKFEHIFNNRQCQSLSSDIDDWIVPSRLGEILHFYSLNDISEGCVKLNPALGSDNIHSFHLKHLLSCLESVWLSCSMVCYGMLLFQMT